MPNPNGVVNNGLTEQSVQLRRRHAIIVRKKDIFLLCVVALGRNRRSMQWRKKKGHYYWEKLVFRFKVLADQLGVNGHNTRLKLDTGAAVTVLSDQTSWLKKMKLLEIQKTLRGPGNTNLPVKGMFYPTLKYRKKTQGDSLCFV